MTCQICNTPLGDPSSQETPWCETCLDYIGEEDLLAPLGLSKENLQDFYEQNYPPPWWGGD